MLKRKIYDKMLKWKQLSNGSSALLIDGARRVGKSFIVKEFAKKEYKTSIIIDFANVSPEVKEIFIQDTTDLNLLYNKLSIYFGLKLYDRESVIIFDEVQQFPPARQLIKYLVADGRYDYIETGSLISLRKNVQNIVIPSEEEHIKLYPLDFEEFLWAMGDEVSMPYVRECFEKIAPVGQALHRKIIGLFRQYMLTGGMPQAVNAYIEKHDFEAVDYVKKRILDLYRNDVSKFASGYEDRVLAVFDEVPGQLSKKEKKYVLSNISKQARYREYDSAFMWLKEAMIINTCFNATEPSVGLMLNLDSSTQKCYMADTGLLVTHTFRDDEFIDNELYKGILFGRLNINEGMLMENITAQALATSGHKLFFFSKKDAETRKNSMEIDFLIRRNKKICPVEVKSGAYNRHVSLDKFIASYKGKIGQPYILYDKDVMEKDGIVHLPLYMAMLL
jgi:hypothetical protein